MAVTLPVSFIQGRRPDGSPNCSHAWARTVDGIQGGTWPQVHLLGSAALERFSGYTAQSRGRHPTHTWNVNRLPDIDYGGVLADQRTPEREVLDALKRVPETGFAIHDASGRVEQLLGQQAELRTLLDSRPSDVRLALRQAEAALASAEQELYWARYRLEHAEDRLERLGSLSQLRRHGRKEKASTIDDIHRFTDEVRRAEAKTDSCREDLEQLRFNRDRRLEWDAEHRWPDEHLRSIDAELAALTRRPQQVELDRPTHLSQRRPDPQQQWFDRGAEVARPRFRALTSGSISPSVTPDRSA